MHSLVARSTPYRVRPAGTRTCANCGIERVTPKTGDYYCNDCIPTAKQLGWIKPDPNTRPCTRCGITNVRNPQHDTCGHCRWNTSNRKGKRK